MCQTRLLEQSHRPTVTGFHMSYNLDLVSEVKQQFYIKTITVCQVYPIMNSNIKIICAPSCHSKFVGQ